MNTRTASRIHVLRDIAADDAQGIPADGVLRDTAVQALDGRLAGELNMRIVSRTESQRLNAQFRGKHKPTNVLSFTPDLPAGFPVALAGDLALCAAVIRQEAEDQGKPLEAHWRHMIVHGCLHLCGYDHQSDADAESMEALEVALLAGMGVSNPYLSPN
ncbi:MAG: rRNA maturation RNase YbeY [Oceanococcaceae bacterium]